MEKLMAMCYAIYYLKITVFHTMNYRISNGGITMININKCKTLAESLANQSREKLSDQNSSWCIKTLRGIGYKLEVR